MTLPLLLGNDADRVSAETRNSADERSALDCADAKHASAAAAAQLRDAGRWNTARPIRLCAVRDRRPVIHQRDRHLIFDKARDDSDALTLMRRCDAFSHSFSTPPTVQLPAAIFERRGIEASKISFRQQNSF